MKICNNCGSQLKDEFKVCPNCGYPVNNQDNSYNSYQYQSNNYNNQFNYQYQNNNNLPTKTNTSCIIGLVAAIVSLLIFPFIMGLVSITFGLNGYCQAKANNEKGRGIAIASVII